MDFILRCNSLKCRSQLHDWAVVTTCSHIFCLPCADVLGLANAATSQRICPACSTSLPNPDDAVRTQLNPTEDYKTSVLSGLSPAIITECAGRALTFWSYQSSQEIIYQDFLAKSLTEKYGDLNVQLDKIINDANAQIENLNQRIQGLQIEQDQLKSDKIKLGNDLREKEKRLKHATDQYEKQRHKHLAAATQSAAYVTADDILASGQMPPDYSNGMQNHSPPGNGNAQNVGQSFAGMSSRPASCRRRPDDFAENSSYAQPEAGSTPQHRQPLGQDLYGPPHAARRGAPSKNWQGQAQAPVSRVPMSNISGNQNRMLHTPRHGMSASMKAGTPQVSRPAYQYVNGRFG